MITQKQWIKILTHGIGLRSEDNPDTIRSAASYAMDCAKQLDFAKYRFQDPIPERWELLLKGTIETMKGFKGSSDRYLMIVEGSRGASFEYLGSFPKCSSSPRSVVASTSLDEDVDVLVQWVLQNLPI